MTAAVARLVQPEEVVAGHLTSLLGALWGSGGLWLLLGVAAGLFDEGWTDAILVVGVLAVGRGALLLVRHDRWLSQRSYAALTVLGAAAISLAVLWGGQVGGAAFGVVFVYVSCFSFIALRPYAVALVATSATLHLAALTLGDHPAPAGVWLVTWGAAVVTGLLASTAVEWLEEALGLVRRADEHKTQFIGTVSHELRTPLTAILGFTETLQARWDRLDDDERRHFVEVIDRQAARQLRLVNDVLAMTTHLAGASPPAPERVDLAVLVDQVVAAVALPVTVETTPVGVHADPDHVEQVVSNLLVNADRYGAPPLLVRTGVRDGRGWIEVVDHGPGLMGGLDGGLLEPFVQGDSGDRRVSSGVGLGLTICRDLVAANDGELAYAETEGGGATFVVTLPLAR